MRPSKLLDPAARERIENAVAQAESTTSGEIVVSVVRDCASHSAAPWRLGAGLAALALLGSAYLPIEGSLAELFGLQAAALVLAHGACRADPIRRAFCREAELVGKAELAAFQCYHEQGIRRTSGRTGILIFVALLEHRVIVLADEAIDKALGPDESWQEIVDLVLAGIRAGDAGGGIERAVLRCGEILSHPLPILEGDRDEIPHALVLSD